MDSSNCRGQFSPLGHSPLNDRIIIADLPLLANNPCVRSGNLKPWYNKLSVYPATSEANMPLTKQDQNRLKAVAEILRAYPPGQDLPYPAQVANDPRMTRHFSGMKNRFMYVGCIRGNPYSVAVFLPRSVFPKYFNRDSLSDYGLLVYRPASNSEWTQLLRYLPQLSR